MALPRVRAEKEQKRKSSSRSSTGDYCLKSSGLTSSSINGGIERGRVTQATYSKYNIYAII
jgi:hypothetical protein